MRKGNFTLPGESGHEALTLQLAKRWGADVIRDSDGARLSEEILSADYGIYSTICVVREHNEWIRANLNARQQTFLSSAPKVAEGRTLVIRPLEGFFEEQFEINDTDGAMRYWQVYDRTTDTLIPGGDWSYDPKTRSVRVKSIPWRQYTVSFPAWRIWEEISMYNHVTNSWNKEHLMQLNPYEPKARAYLKDWLTKWCRDNPRTNVVRFTSMFYNFVWIWGADPRRRDLFTDWAGYDFTISTTALDDFEKEYGYALCAEDFVRQGKYNATHSVPNQKKRDWMEFIGKFVRGAGRELVDIVHAAGKKAYVFYDDNWVGIEPYSGHFEEFAFDGVIKCVFSGYEVRLCADVPVPTHEIRFHPYLFPVGLGGAPTFSEGGAPGLDALNYWVGARRALLRKKIDRCGLGGYLSLTEGFPCFIEAMDRILDEFRLISELHDAGPPAKLKPRVAVLHAWGKLRTWTLSGHFHETDAHTLIHILESLSGLPFDVEFLSFEDIKQIPGDVDLIINAGQAGDAWSGGVCWDDEKIIESLTEWVHSGGVFLGADEPSALAGRNKFLRMSHVLGMDIDRGEYACHGKWSFKTRPAPGLIPDGAVIPGRKDVVLTDARTVVLSEHDASPTLTALRFGSGMGLYCAGFAHNPASPRFLQNLILYATGCDISPEGTSDNAMVECTYYPNAAKIIFANNSEVPQTTSCTLNGKIYKATLASYEMQVMRL